MLRLVLQTNSGCVQLVEGKPCFVEPCYSFEVEWSGGDQNSVPGVVSTVGAVLFGAVEA